MSDLEFEGMKGKVKNLRYESIYYENGSGLSKKGQFYTVAKFDEDGNMFEETAFEQEIPIRKTSVWREVDYTFKRFEKLNSALTQDIPPPVIADKTQNKSTVRNPELETKSKFVHDLKNNSIEAFFYLYDIFSKDMKIISRKLYKYDSKRNKIKETIFNEDGKISSVNVFVYDSKMQIKKEKVTNADQTKYEKIYLYSKIDKHGNWLERKSYYKIAKKSPTLSYVEYRIINYY